MRAKPIIVAAVLMAGGVVQGNVFNMGAGLTSLETVPVGDPGNAADTEVMFTDGTTGYGAVGYRYNIGTYEVTAGQYTEFLNAVAATDTYGLYDTYMDTAINVIYAGCNIKRTGSSGSYAYTVASDWANRPVNHVSWGDAARFANWLHNGQPTGAQGPSTTEDGAYNLSATHAYYGPNGEIPTFNTPDYFSLNAALLAVSRKANWKWAITSEDEWYKAAYYKGGATNAGYWDYPTKSNTEPSNVGSDGYADPGNHANFYSDGHPIDESDYDGYTIDGPYYRTNVGEFENSASAYGTFDQGGNVSEWNEAVVGDGRGVRGGSFDFGSSMNWDQMPAEWRGSDGPTFALSIVGFRVVQVPEPATLSLLALLAVSLSNRGGLAVMRKRRK